MNQASSEWKPPTKAQIKAARECKPVYVPPDAQYRNGWRIVGPRGVEQFYDSEEEAELMRDQW